MVQGIHCIDDGAVDKGNLRIWGTMVKKPVGAAEPWLASITTICLCIYFKVELDGVGRDSEDKVKFPEGHPPARGESHREKLPVHSGGARIVLV